MTKAKGDMYMCKKRAFLGKNSVNYAEKCLKSGEKRLLPEAGEWAA